MPSYDFRCESCGRVKEVVQRFAEEPPTCCGKAMARLFSAPAIITMKEKGGTKIHSKGYKEGYAKDYMQRREALLESQKS